MSTIDKEARMTERVYNFSAGPAALPLAVLEQVREELLSYQGCGMSVMEMSHRSKEFDAILAGAEAGVRRVLNVPDDYAVLFLPGGATQQFVMAPMNLVLKGKPVDMIDTGVWTKKAMEPIKKLGVMNLAASTESEKYSRLPRAEEIRLSEDASYVHLCSNNTIAGTQWKKFPETGKAPVVADMSSDIASRPIDVNRFGLIFAGAQKNIGPAGMGLVILRKDLAERADAGLPAFMQYREHIKAGSRYNTPPSFGIYITGLVMQWIEKLGGLSAIAARNRDKAAVLYEAIDAGDFYFSPVNRDDRSDMNVVFRIQADNQDELEARFVKEAAQAGLSGLKGHRLVGGLRASIYNAMEPEGVQALVDFMKDFEKKNS